ncbi:uncharacterized protein LMH87_008944 [Akanthomyces muscarius]|uniref:Myb-like domain-containing protein n=1 Tax=Akanthomyces muscarius TaxID=2231603 RepID=A0A9W8QK73_AKAMU|nr:uncharacterized protein LMH87_008944 [Akanthomyces muscarius]KAJ4158417.1 hypothetical protein LMH87_008944 [Akanthomyces muscarius]
MENDWMQSISDVEIESHYGRMPRFDRTPIEHDNSYAASPSASQTTQNSSMPGSMYNAAQASNMGSSPSYNGSAWQTESNRLDFGGVSSATMSAVWSQNSYPTYIPDTSISLPCTPAPVGLYQTPGLGPSSQMPHLNTPPASAVSFSKLTSEDSTEKSQLKVDTGAHGYFKENGSVIMNKWFSNTTSQIAPPQLIYNVPPPASLSSQDSFNDASSIASGNRLSATPSRLHPARSDFSNQLSFTSSGDFSSQSPQTGYSTRRRLPYNASPSPTIVKNSDIQDGGSHDSPSGATSVALSVYESDSSYGASGAQSIQPSRLPSPVLSEHHKNAQNEFLVKARAEGMSYRDIKVKGGFTEAESTLRGRHRMLTKDKEDRVRKPEWTEKDIELLKKGVRAHTRPNMRTGKTSWKRVAEYIADHGGSYSFGYATCHNKWKELPAGRRR